MTGIKGIGVLAAGAKRVGGIVVMRAVNQVVDITTTEGVS